MEDKLGLPEEFSIMEDPDTDELLLVRDLLVLAKFTPSKRSWHFVKSYVEPNCYDISIEQILSITGGIIPDFREAFAHFL